MKYNPSAVKEQEEKQGVSKVLPTLAHLPKTELHISLPASTNSSSQPRVKKLSMRSLLWLSPQHRHQESHNSMYSQLLPVLAVHLGSFSVGAAIAFPILLGPHLVPGSEGVQGSLDLTSDSAATGWTGTCFLLGAASGGILFSLLGSIRGRRTSLLASSITDLLGWGLIFLASLLPDISIHIILAGRFLTGLAASGYLSNIQIYVAEIVQTEHRGWMGGLSLPFASIGVLTMYVLGPWLTWSQTSLFCMVPSILMVGLLLQLWDTPYYYLMQYREKDAHGAMNQLRKGDPAAMAEIFSIQDTIEHDMIEGGILARLLLLCTQKRYYSPFVILNFLLIITIFIVITSLNTFTNELFQKGDEYMDPYLSSIISGLLYLAGSCLFLPLVKHNSRKLLQISSSVILTFSLCLFGIYLYSQTRYEDFFIAVSQSHWLPVLCFSVFLISAPIGLTSIPLLYTAELFPTEMRSLLSGLTMSLCSLSILMIQLLLPSLTSSMMPHGAVWLSSTACVISMFLCLSCVPETRNKDLSQIPEKFAQWRKVTRASPWVTPISSPAHSRCATPTREVKNFDFKTQMFTK